MAKTKSQSENKIRRNFKNRKFGVYSDAALQAALQDIKDNGISIREASRRYGIPRATMHDKYTGKSPAAKKKTGPPPILTVDGETKIANWACNIAKCGFPISKNELMEAVAKIAKDTGKSGAFPNGEPGVRWYKGFLKRHPEISQREAEGINKARSLITEESIRLWFSTLQKYLQENNFQSVLEDPARIFNGDESGFSLCPKSGKVLGPKGWKNLYMVKSGKEKENITVLITFNATGDICPPLVIFPYVRPPKALVDNVPSNWVIGKSESGWMTGDVFYEYISNNFNDWVTEKKIKRPVLLLIDGHRSHMTIPLSQFCSENEIILYALPPNTTHILQPADVSVFKPMKQEWKNTLRNWHKLPENANQVVTKINFCKVFQKTLQDIEMKTYIVKGFRKCGLYPFNPDNVDYSKCVKNFLENCQKQVVSECVSEAALGINEFNIALEVIKHIGEDLQNNGVNLDVVINQLNLHKSMLEVDSNKTLPSSSTTASSDETRNVELGSIVSMDSLTVMPIDDVMDIQEQLVLDNVYTSWTPELADLPQNIIVPEKKDIGSRNEEVSADIVVALADNEKENRGVKCNEKESDNEKETENCEETDMEIESDKENGTLNEYYKGNEEGNDKENKLPNQQERQREIETKTDKETDTKNKETILETENTTVILYDKINNSTNNGDSMDEMAQKNGKTKDMIVGNKETGESTNKVEDEVVTTDPFQKHLTFPEASSKKTHGCRSKEKLPSAISSAAWRNYYTRKDDEKKEKLEKANIKRKNKEEKRCQKQTKPTEKSKNKIETLNDNAKMSPKKNYILCTLCEEDLISDAEEDENKNIGCDKCPRWYHLKCTDMSDLTYNDAAEKDYVCDMCR